jgi:hypothetical protein
MDRVRLPVEMGRKRPPYNNIVYNVFVQLRKVTTSKPFHSTFLSMKRRSWNRHGGKYAV